MGRDMNWIGQWRKTCLKMVNSKWKFEYYEGPYKEKLGMAFQTEGILFGGSIEKNMKYSRNPGSINKLDIARMM